MKSPTLSEIKSNFYYIEGEWKLRHLTTKSSNAKENDLAGNLNARGYVLVKMNRISYRAHRLLYQMYKGIEILDSGIYIDHIDGDTTNNSPDNLRLCNSRENQFNSKKSRNNKSGHKNILKVNWISKGKTYCYWRIDIRSGNDRYVKDFKYEEPLPQYIIDLANQKRIELHGEYANEGTYPKKDQTP